MKKLAVWLMLAVMIFAVISGGCGGGSDSSDPEQSESLNENTGEYDPNEGARGNSGSSGREIDLSKLTANYTAKNGDILTGTLGSPFPIRVADGATITLRNVTINGEILSSYLFVGFRCVGDATIILEGTNYVQTLLSDVSRYLCPGRPYAYDQGQWESYRRCLLDIFSRNRRRCEPFVRKYRD